MMEVFWNKIEKTKQTLVCNNIAIFQASTHTNLHFTLLDMLCLWTCFAKHGFTCIVVSTEVKFVEN